MTSSVASSASTRMMTSVPGAGWAPSSTVKLAVVAPASSTDPLIAPTVNCASSSSTFLTLTSGNSRPS